MADLLRIIGVREIAAILTLFLIVQFGGLLIAYIVSTTNSSGIIIQRLTSPQSLFFSYVVDALLLCVLLLLLFNRHKRHNRELWDHRFFALFEGVVLASTSFFTFLFLFTALLGTYIKGLYFAAALACAILLVIFRRERPFVKNTATVVSSIGVGLLLGFYFSFEYAMIILVIVAVYDYIAVFVTKSMIRLAERLSEENVAFLIDEEDIEAIPDEKVDGRYVERYLDYLHKTRKDEDPLYKSVISQKELPIVSRIQLGEGDLGLPLMASVSIFFSFNSPFLAVLLIDVAAIGLLATMLFFKRYKSPLPAIPPLFSFISVTAGLALGTLGIINRYASLLLIGTGVFVIAVGIVAELSKLRKEEAEGLS